MPARKTTRRTARVEGIGRGADLFVRAFFRLPYLNRWHPWVRADRTDMRWLPINEEINAQENVPMPVELLDRLIEEASHRVIVEYCGCRKHFGCTDYPVETGCLMMGDTALEISNFPAREVGVEEAKAHARRAVEAGLVPVVGKARADNFIFKVKDRHHLLSVCFCCECCCITRFASYLPLRYLEPTFPRPEGVSVSVTDGCTGCGKCVAHCFVQAIEITDGKAVIGEHCRACGRCASACPNGAVEIRLTDPEFVEKTRDRIRSYVKYD